MLLYFFQFAPLSFDSVGKGGRKCTAANSYVTASERQHPHPVCMSSQIWELISTDCEGKQMGNSDKGIKLWGRTNR